MTSATGPDNEGCFQCESDGSGSGDGSGAGECNSCDDTKFGCCPDNLRAAKGPDGEGCESIESINQFSLRNHFKIIIYLKTIIEMPLGGSGDLIQSKPDSEIDCKKTEFGCCPDEKTAGNLAL